jgi:hypothetical protein
MFGFVLALDTAPAHPADPPKDPDPALTAFFAHFAEHAGLYRSLLGPTGSARVIAHVRRRTTAAAHYSGRLAPTGDPPPQTAGSPDFPLDVPAAFVAGALLGVAADWLQRGCPRTPLEMTILTKPLLIALRPGTGTPPTSQGSQERARNWPDIAEQRLTDGPVRDQRREVDAPLRRGPAWAWFPGS